MYSITVALAIHRRMERELRTAGLEPCEHNLKWWAGLSTKDRCYWLGLPVSEVA